MSALSLAVDPFCGSGQPTFDIELPVFAPQKPTVVVSRRRWLQDEILSLASCYPAGEPVADISKRLGRSLTAVYGKARRLGLSRPQRGCVPVEMLREAPIEQIEMALPPPALDLLPTTPADPPFAPPVEMPCAVKLRCSPKPFRLTTLGGRETVWSADQVRRLILLWVAGFHHTTIAEVLDLTPCGVSSKAVRISLPYRGSVTLSRDMAAARLVDAAGGPVPKMITTATGQQVIGKRCNLTGNWFYAERGVHTCVEAKLTLHYSRMQSAF